MHDNMLSAVTSLFGIDMFRVCDDTLGEIQIDTYQSWTDSNNRFECKILTIRWKLLHPVDTGRKLNVHKTFNLIPASTWQYGYPRSGSRRKKCPYSEFFWSVYSRIWSQYGDLQSKYSYSVQIGEIRTRKSPNTDTFYS